MSEVERTGFNCFCCGRPNACATENGGNLVEGLPLKSCTPGDTVFCKVCLKDIAKFIETTRGRCKVLTGYKRAKTHADEAAS